MKHKRKKISKLAKKEISWGSPKRYQGGHSKKSFRKPVKRFDDMIFEIG